MVQTQEDMGNTKTYDSQVESFPLCSLSTKQARWRDSLKACTLQYDSVVTGDEEGSDGRLCTVPILNVFGRLERRSREGKGKGEIRSEEKTELEPIMSSPNTTKSLACLNHVTPGKGRITSHTPAVGL